MGVTGQERSEQRQVCRTKRAFRIRGVLAVSRWLWQVVPSGIIDAETTADTTGPDVRAKPAEESFATPGATDHSPTKNRLEDYGDRAEGSYEHAEWYQPYFDCGPVETWEQPPKTTEDKHPAASQSTELAKRL